MKSNAPEKIWVHELSAKELNVPLKEYHVEYVRTDAFVDKAVEFLRKECKGFKLREIEIQKFIEYMKGE